MSVINKMLRNIDRQMEGSEGSKSPANDWGMATVPLDTTTISRPLLITGLMLVVIWFGWKFTQPKTEMKIAVVPQAQLPRPPQPALSPQVAAWPSNASSSGFAPAAAATAETAVADPSKISESTVSNLPAKTPVGSRLAAADSPSVASPASHPKEFSADVSVFGENKQKKLKPGVNDASQQKPEVSPASDSSDKTVPKPTATRVAMMKVVTAEQKSENIYQVGYNLMQQSQFEEAESRLKEALSYNARNFRARALLSELMIDQNRGGDAAQVLKEGLMYEGGKASLLLPLARLQVAGGNQELAITTLKDGAGALGHDPDYHAFYAALLQEKGMHDAAVEHYLNALNVNPAMPNWLVGIGISLQALDKKTDAIEAYQRAIDSGELNSDQLRFSEEQISNLRR